MSLIESNVRVDERDYHPSYQTPGRGGGTRVTTVCVRAADDQGPYALTAAELAAIESNRTREKLKTKAEHVAHFHRKVVRRLAAEKRAADACARGGKVINARIGSIDTFANVLESSGFTLEDKQGMLWEHALPSQEEAPYYRVVKIIGARGDKKSLSDADTAARMALAAYRR
eukprot:g7620.t1